jgi:hypothetical protein
MVAGLESGQFLQTWIYELMNPTVTAQGLLALSGRELPVHDMGTDCNDAYESLVKPTTPAPAQKSLVLYIAALREAKAEGFVRSWLWFDTTDDLANCLTKLNENGTIPLSDLTESLRDSFYEPRKPYRWNGMLTDPIKVDRKPAKIVKRPPAPTPKPTTTSTTEPPDTLTYLETTYETAQPNDTTDDHWYEDEHYDTQDDNEPILSGVAPDMFRIHSDDEMWS